MSKTVAERYNSIKKDLTEKMCTGNLGGLSLLDLKAVYSLLAVLIESHSAKTFIETVANYFSTFGFKVVMDFDKINYVIVEA